MKYRLHTIGHSNQSQEDFLGLLQRHDINCVVDVRSVPASKHNPQFNEDALRAFLLGKGIDYQFFGYEFGARRMDSINQDGQVDFEQAVKTVLFRQGVGRLQSLMAERNVTLMCSEADPLECHRFALVARYFHEQGVLVSHILGNGTAVAHQDLERQMVARYLHAKRPLLSDVDELFGSYTPAQQLADAYRLKNKEIGYRQDVTEYYD